MKNKIISTLTFCLLAFSGWSQSPNSYATARIFESNLADASRIVLVYENGENEIIPLKNWKLFGSLSSANTVMIENQKIINQMMNDMKQKGYEVKGITSSAEGGYFYSFIVFSKKEDR